MLLCSHQSPNPKRHLDRFSRFCTDHDRVSLYFTTDGPFLPLKLPLSMGTWTPLTDDSLRLSEPTTQTASRSVRPFLQVTIGRIYVRSLSISLCPIQSSPLPCHSTLYFLHLRPFTDHPFRLCHIHASEIQLRSLDSAA